MRWALSPAPIFESIAASKGSHRLLRPKCSAIETVGSLPTILSEPGVEMLVHFEFDSSLEPGVEMVLHFDCPCM